jgi:hypothetical protein
LTSAEAQAFKRACSCLGLGRYFYDFAEQWVELDGYKRPKQTPKLGVRSADPENQQTKSTAQSSQGTARPSAGVFHPSAKTIEKIESYKELLGDSLYQEVLTVIGKSQTARSLPSEESVNAVLHWLQRAANGIQKARDLAEDLSVGEFEHVLNGQKIRRLNAVPTMKASALREWGLSLGARGGSHARRRAMVAVARKLAVLLHRIWITQEVYMPFYEVAA